jgi:hypothetical protein
MGEGEERESVAAELRRIREAVQARVLLEPGKVATESAPGPGPAPGKATAEPLPELAAPPLRPDGSAVNALWDVAKAPAGSVLGGWMRRLLGPFIDAQVAWNAKQVQLDNAILEYLDARLDATHRHYDRVLGIQGRHIQDANERHLILQEELVAHVHDLVKRIDLVLGESEKGRLSLEFALRDVRNRLARVEERLNRG